MRRLNSRISLLLADKLRHGSNGDNVERLTGHDRSSCGSDILKQDHSKVGKCFFKFLFFLLFFLVDFLVVGIAQFPFLDGPVWRKMDLKNALRLLSVMN